MALVFSWLYECLLAHRRADVIGLALYDARLQGIAIEHSDRQAWIESLSAPLNQPEAASVARRLRRKYGIQPMTFSQRVRARATQGTTRLSLAR
jgi:hypothetical protein